MLPIYILDGTTVLPETGNYYVLAKNGLFLHKDTGLIKAQVRVDKISALKELEPTAILRLPKIPAEYVIRSYMFFRAIYRRHRSEAATLLYYAADTQEYLLHCPEQKVLGLAVDEYRRDDRFPGYQLVGSIHSHANIGAFHSFVDKNDEKDFDGIHITLGNVDQPYFTASASIVVNNNRFPIDPQETTIGMLPVDWQPVNRYSVRRTVPASLPAKESRGLISDIKDLLKGEPWGDYFPAVRSEQYYNMALPDGGDYRNIGFPKSWLEKVKKTAYVAPLYYGGKTAASGKVILPPPVLDTDFATMPTCNPADAVYANHGSE